MERLFYLRKNAALFRLMRTTGFLYKIRMRIMKLSYPSKQQFLYLFIATFLIRALVFYTYVQHNERYRQADSMDYHNCALGIACGTGMHRADTLKPIFWRTPGYPVLLAAMYKYCGLTSPVFAKNQTAQKYFLWLQIFVCSFTPIILFLLAFLLTSNLLIAYLLAIICMVHPGFVLASMYLLTEGLAILLFYFFLLYFYRSFKAYGEAPLSHKQWIFSLIMAALSLAAYTWMRPMGEFICVIAIMILLATAMDQWNIKLKKSALFFLMFGLCISPWYIRNYRLTGHWFFCPMSGAYLNSFIAPKIVRDLNGIPLDRSINLCYRLAQKTIDKEEARLQGSGCFVSKEITAKKIAWPIIIAHPFIAFKHWMKEVIKTTFDLYGCQLAALASGSFLYDPLEEFLIPKTCDAVWLQAMPCIMRIIIWIELLFVILLWLGLFAGFWRFMLQPLIHRAYASSIVQKTSGLWIKTAPLIWAVLFMTGGFGYARLRLPIEPLMIILSLTWWLYWYQKDTFTKDCSQ